MHAHILGVVQVDIVQLSVLCISWRCLSTLIPPRRKLCAAEFLQLHSATLAGVSETTTDE